MPYDYHKRSILNHRFAYTYALSIIFALLPVRHSGKNKGSLLCPLLSSRVFYLSLAAFLGVYLIDSCLSDINLAFAASYIVNADTDTTADNQKPPLPPLPPCNSINCSFGEAIGAANANPGKDSILFGIPFVKPDSSPFISDPIVIDGGGDTVLDGRQLPIM